MVWRQRSIRIEHPTGGWERDTTHDLRISAVNTPRIWKTTAAGSASNTVSPQQPYGLSNGTPTAPLLTQAPNLDVIHGELSRAGEQRAPERRAWPRTASCEILIQDKGRPIRSGIGRKVKKRTITHKSKCNGSHSLGFNRPNPGNM